MKKLIFTLATCLFALSLTASPLIATSPASAIDGVQQNSNTPGVAALKFMKVIQGKSDFSLDLFYSKDLEEVYALYEQLSPEQRAVVDEALKEESQKLVKELLKEMPEITVVTFSVLEEIISQDGKSAVVKMQLHHEGSSAAKEMYLVKHKGKWKVDVDKL
jgi:TRAP-type C4-dicarboxylate transport system substrate-binding protein